MGFTPQCQKGQGKDNSISPPCSRLSFSSIWEKLAQIENLPQPFATTPDCASSAASTSSRLPQTAVSPTSAIGWGPLQICASVIVGVGVCQRRDSVRAFLTGDHASSFRLSISLTQMSAVLMLGNIE